MNVYVGTEQGLLPRLRHVPERVYVPNSLSNTVDVVNPSTYKVVRSIPVGSQPQHITPSYDMRHLYVDNTADDTLTTISPQTGKKMGTTHVLDPYNLYFTLDGKRAIVVAERYQRLDFRNPHSWRLVKSVHIPSPGPDHLDFSANGRFLLISAEFSGAVYRVDTQRMKVTGSVQVGGRPVDVRLSPDGAVFYVANQGRSGVSVIDPQKMREIKFLPTGAGAHGLYTSRDAKHLYVSNRLAGTISVISFASRRVVATWHVGGSPDMIQLSPDGSEMWVSNRFNSSVSVVDTANGALLHTIPVGSSPHGLTYFPAPGHFSLGHNGVYR